MSLPLKYLVFGYPSLLCAGLSLVCSGRRATLCQEIQSAKGSRFVFLYIFQDWEDAPRWVLSSLALLTFHIGLVFREFDGMMLMLMLLLPPLLIQLVFQTVHHHLPSSTITLLLSQVLAAYFPQYWWPQFVATIWFIWILVVAVKQQSSTGCCCAWNVSDVTGHLIMNSNHTYWITIDSTRKWWLINNRRLINDPWLLITMNHGKRFGCFSK